ncbi:hypothetical protein AWB67_07570 [Caballeronia terrestris]|uniref:Uncharacterized protein n=2 Tax=Caballeronia TaxID=1827195 RepID=A0A158L6F8_9BURK|nr:hypothetical protein AWB65_06959 [Caballeronia humi]SAL88301.1 hypothetical protein AWB67_07570 [Caballeronia terrestris]
MRLKTSSAAVSVKDDDEFKFFALVHVVATARDVSLINNSRLNAAKTSQ